jgi:Kef-type K+ transport system membrane component KefB/nucleotide-binding universal stress UspA family protein
VLEPLGEHDLLVFWAQFALLLIVARGLGYLFRRAGQPSVVGELGAGLLIGPSVFGRFLPAQADWVFPGTELTSAPILAVAWVGVALLLAETGFETDLGLLRRLGRKAAAVSIGSLVVPMALGFAIGWVMPAGPFLGDAATRFTFAAFVAVAMSISALPVVARILTELDLMRRDIGQVTVAAAMVNDLIGWILLGTLVGIVTSGTLAVGSSITTVLAIVAFFAFAFTVGQRLTDRALRAARVASTGLTGPVTVTLAVVLVAATVTQAIGVEAVLGAFVAGIVLGRSPYQRPEVRRTVELMSAAVFAPIFFATAGIYVDLGAVANAQGLLWGSVIVVVASLGKLAGSYVGARASRMSHDEGVAIGVGLNARGAMEIVLATIAFSIGVFSQDAYTLIVLMAMVTSLIAPPLLRRALRDVSPAGEEAGRLAREEVLESSVIASTTRALLPTRGGDNSRLAADALDHLLQPGASITVLTVHDPAHDPATCGCEEALDEVVQGRSSDRTVERRRLTSSDAAAAVLAEAGLGYGMVGLGLTERFRETHELSTILQQLIANTPVPLLLVRHGAPGVELRDTRRVLVPANGVRHGRAAEEVGAVLATRLDADLDLVHVVARRDREPTESTPPVGGTGTATATVDAAAGTIIEQAVQRASSFGARAEGLVRSGAVAPEAIIAAADERGADLLVVSVQARAVEGHPFLGHGTEYLLEHATQTVLAVIFPPDASRGD